MLKTVDDIAAMYPRNRVYFSDGAGRIGFRSGGHFDWYSMGTKGERYALTGITRSLGPYTTKHKIPVIVR